jgi:hypothetical protein
VLVSDASLLEIDHVVALANTNASGGYAWSPTQRRAYANDLTDDATLAAVAASANRDQGRPQPRPLDAAPHQLLVPVRRGLDLGEEPVAVDGHQRRA